MKNKKVRQMFKNMAIGTDIIEIASDGTIANELNWPVLNGRKRSAKEVRATHLRLRSVYQSIMDVSDMMPHDPNNLEEVVAYVDNCPNVWEVYEFVKRYHIGFTISVRKQYPVDVLVGSRYDLTLLSIILKRVFLWDIGLKLCNPERKDPLFDVLGERYARLYRRLTKDDWQIKQDMDMSDARYLAKLLSNLSPYGNPSQIADYGRGRLKFLEVPNEVVNYLQSMEYVD